MSKRCWKLFVMCLHVHMHSNPTNAEADMAFSWQGRRLMAAPWMHTRFYLYSTFPKGQIFEPCPRSAGAKPVNCGFSQLRLDKPRFCCWFITCSSEIIEWKTNIYALQVHRMAFKKLVPLLFCVMRRKVFPCEAASWWTGLSFVPHPGGKIPRRLWHSLYSSICRLFTVFVS